MGHPLEQATEIVDVVKAELKRGLTDVAFAGKKQVFRPVNLNAVLVLNWGIPRYLLEQSPKVWGAQPRLSRKLSDGKRLLRVLFDQPCHLVHPKHMRNRQLLFVMVQRANDKEQNFFNDGSASQHVCDALARPLVKQFFHERRYLERVWYP